MITSESGIRGTVTNVFEPGPSSRAQQLRFALPEIKEWAASPGHEAIGTAILATRKAKKAP